MVMFVRHKRTEEHGTVLKPPSTYIYLGIQLITTHHRADRLCDMLTPHKGVTNEQIGLGVGYTLLSWQDNDKRYESNHAVF